MDIIDSDYQHEEHIFLYDNATTHLKRPANGLSAVDMPLTRADPLKPNRKSFLFATVDAQGTETFVQMEGARFANGTVQQLYYPEDHKWASQFKGMRTIIEERRNCGANLPDPRKLLAQCKNFKCQPGATDCCCRRILYTEPDFKQAKSLLEQQCEAQGYKVIFLPKFHCELNFIEQCWGYAKRLYREYPLTTTEDDLIANAVRAVDDVPLHSMRR